MNRYTSLAGLLAALALTFVGTAYGDKSEKTGPAKDGWITGKIETVYLLNPHLNPFTIHTETTNGRVHLTGTVESDIDRDLAGEIAKGIEGVVAVDNDLKVSPSARESERAKMADGRPFGVWIEDLTTTAMIKTKLLTDPNVGGLKINVDTRNNIVTLTGEVSSAEERQLAGKLASNTGDVKQVHNQIVVKRGS